MMARTSLAPGFRFSPTDLELVSYYLKRKVMGKTQFEAIAEVDLYKFAPWDLPDKSQLHSKDLVWYFFCPRDRKYPNGSRANRATNIGYWKATGKDRSIAHNSCTVGMKKTLVFHVGKPPKGSRTDWVMYEFRLENEEPANAGISQDAYVLCKIFQKSGPGPKVGDQYGAPFNEEDYEDDTTTESSFPLCPEPSDDHTALTKPVRQQPTPSFPLHPEPSDNRTTLINPISQQPMPCNVVEMPSDPDPFEVDGILLEDLLEILPDFLSTSPFRDTANDEMPDSSTLHTNEASFMDPERTYNELENLSSQAFIPDNTNYAGKFPSEPAQNLMLSELDDEQYVELNDFWTSNPFESMPNDPSSSSMHRDLTIIDQTSYFYIDASTAMYDSPPDSGAQLTSAQPPQSVQDLGGLMHLPDAYSDLSPAQCYDPFH